MGNKTPLYYLAQLLDTDISVIEAADRLRDICPEEEEAVNSLYFDIKRGRTLATAIKNAGFSSGLEYEILNIAETTGKLENALRFVSSRYEERHRRARELRTRLLLPNAMMIVLLLISAVYMLIVGVGFFTVLFNTIFIVLFVVVVTYALLMFTRNDATYWLSFGWQYGLQQTSVLFRRYSEYTFFTLFVWQVEAGLDYISGAKSLTTLIDAEPYKNAVNNYQKLVRAGEPVVDALLSIELIVPGELAQVIKTGEESGRMSQSLQHYLLLEQQRL